MTEKIPQELIGKILADLTAARNMDDIVREVCESANLDWKQSEALVYHLAAKNRHDITLSQSPVLVLLAFFTFISGVGLVFYGLYQFYLVYSADSKTFLFQMLFLGMNGQSVFWSLLFGGAMIFGSLKGMQSVWAAVLERWERR
jgi:hypothetical protein